MLPSRVCQQVYIHINNHAGYYPGAKQIDIKLLFAPKVHARGGGDGMGWKALTSAVLQRHLAHTTRLALRPPALARLVLCCASLARPQAPGLPHVYPPHPGLPLGGGGCCCRRRRHRRRADVGGSGAQDGRVLGMQAAGDEGVEKRVDVVAMAIQMKATVYDLEEVRGERRGGRKGGKEGGAQSLAPRPHARSPVPLARTPARLNTFMSQLSPPIAPHSPPRSPPHPCPALPRARGRPPPHTPQAELCYAPQYGSAKDPVNIAGMVAANVLRGLHPATNWDQADLQASCLGGTRKGVGGGAEKGAAGGSGACLCVQLCVQLCVHL